LQVPLAIRKPVLQIIDFLNLLSSPEYNSSIERRHWKGIVLVHSA